MKRITILAALFIVTLLAIATVYGGEENGSGVWPAAIERKLTCDDVAGKDFATVNLMKNEIYARHGRVFQTADLKDYFESQPWYSPDPKFTNAKLSKLENENIAFLAKCEKAAQAGQSCCAQTSPEIATISGIVNAAQFGKFTTEAKTKIEKDGFVVMPGPNGQYDQFFHVYEANDYRKIPNFITSDSILHTYHIFFDFSLRDVEENKLLGNLELLTDKMIELSLRDFKAATDAAVKDAAMRNVAFFATAYALLHNRHVAGVDTPTRMLADEEMSNVKTGATAVSPINGVVIDYTMFKPRGHYTRSDDLKRYFAAMMWYGIAPLEIGADKHAPTIRAVLIASELYDKGGPIALWESIYGPTVFYVGAADDVTPAIVWEALAKKSPTPTELADSAWRGAIIKKIQSLSSMRIVNRTATGPQAVQFRFMGQRYTPDGEVFQKLSSFPERPFPRGLDLMAALGVEEASNILRDTYKEGQTWPQYWTYLNEQKERLGKLSADDWNSNLYYRWIHLLKTVNEVPAGVKTPPFMTTRSWKLKSLVTSLASWAELRHDTILYAKPSMAECGGDEYEPPFVRGYVEPNPKLYAELKQLVIETREGLKSRGVLTDDFIETSKTLEETVDFLERMSKKELNGEKLSRQEYDEIRIYGSTLEYLTVRLMTGSYESWDMVKGPDRSVAVVADIHTSQGAVLEEGVGNVWEIYVVVPIEGKNYLTRGGVFSYYEFTQPASNRLSDEEWQKMLKTGKAPPAPEWTDPFKCGQPKRETPAIEQYSSGC